MANKYYGKKQFLEVHENEDKKQIYLSGKKKLIFRKERRQFSGERRLKRSIIITKKG